MEKQTKKGPVVLVILDGWGEWNIVKGNAIANAKLPTIDMLNKNYPKLSLQASGLSVGLPWDICGNSEAGHQAMGTGQIIFQNLPSIDMLFKNRTFENNEILRNIIKHVKEKKVNLHFWGLVSDGNVHSNVSHLTTLLRFMKENGCENSFVHAVTDGRDTDPKSAKKYLGDLDKFLKDEKCGSMASVIGRYYAMDRNSNWDRTEKAFDLMINGIGVKELDPIIAIENQYKNKIIDEYIEPIVMVNSKNKPIGLIKKGDVVVCFNFREDRSKQLATAFTNNSFDKFSKVKVPREIILAGFINYGKDIEAEVIFPEQKISTRVGDTISQANKKQLRIAETEKYAHVTYFFNGGLEKAFPGEDRILVPSKMVNTYAKAPEMSAKESTEVLLKALEKEKYDFILLNYANPDMVGHTGNLKAAIKAVECVDVCLEKIIKAVLEKEGSLIVTADHGNVEEMINLTTMRKDTKHSANPVPCWLVSNQHKKQKPSVLISTNLDGMIIDIAATVLELLDLKKPEGMISRSLLGIFNVKSESDQ